ncbi:hypothetical protein B0A48_01846 [Cryoendolithus antarcticus]|uniref:Ankyrin repeat protein n=1 Tax=Cryoendolithus antarcticus TaxID=1507870 RepID=A0A1V8TQG3_9PEZI|nr:hypothetical protein B0A48_01846 [Cryoendolithus antarcticus]
MATQGEAIMLPDLPAAHGDFLEYIAAHQNTPMNDLLSPYKAYDAEMRKIFAQQTDHPAASKSIIVPIFNGNEQTLKIRARDLKIETDKQRESFIMPLKADERKKHGSPAVVQTLQDFKTNFALFSESSLADLDWSNVCVSGSAAVTALLPVPKEHAVSKKALRHYYHDILAPASDVDLFLYGLTEEQAIEKIMQLEKKIKDALLVETTTIRTKHAITIASQYPTRHVQIVLRRYSSLSEILLGFDVDSSCAAFDGRQVYASPRALAAYMTQINTIDLTRRSPSYENRLSKYRQRGFEVHWPELDRSRIDPTIFERSFGRTEGLARLLIIEKLPKSDERDAYIDQRREERGRPRANRMRQKQKQIRGNIKNGWENEVAEWVEAEDVSNYHTFTVPYGPEFHARKIEKLLYTKDLLLNSEWNKPQNREVNLHRHPAFFGNFEEVMKDCCGFCPVPSTMEEEEVTAEERKIYVSGDITFITDDPGRQTIGSFHPISSDDYTDQAYVGNTQALMQAIVDCDLEYVLAWLEHEGNDPNTRDYTGRTPLHLAVVQSSLEVVQCLIDHGARLMARVFDGKTALHLAAIRGSTEIVSALLRKSEANEEEEEAKVDIRRQAYQKAKMEGKTVGVSMLNLSQQVESATIEGSDSDIDMIETNEVDDVDMGDATTEHSMVNIKTPTSEGLNTVADDDEDEPDVYDVNKFGADVLLPVKLFNDNDKSARAAILTLVLASRLPLEQAKKMSRTLFELGASSAQADIGRATALQYAIGSKPELFESYIDADKTGVSRAINHVAVTGGTWNFQVSTSLMTAITNGDAASALHLLGLGAKPEISVDVFLKALPPKATNLHSGYDDSANNKRQYERNVKQPLQLAIDCELPALAIELLERHGVDANILTSTGHEVLQHDYVRRYQRGQTMLDLVQGKIQALRDWKPVELRRDPPKALSSSETYLAGLKEGTYGLWTAKHQLAAAKETYRREWTQHVEHLKAENDKTGYEEKQAAVFDMLDGFKKLQGVLNAKGGKTFYELHPEIDQPTDQQNNAFGSWQAPKPEPFKMRFWFNLQEMHEELVKKYLQLYEATWASDVAKLKQLCLVPWTNDKGEQQAPLKIAVTDTLQLSPFAIAVMHGDLDLAKLIMEIAEAQYVLPGSDQQRRYRLNGGDDDDESDEDASDDDTSDGHELALASDVVDDTFTIENVGEISMQVKSHTKPLNVLNGRFPADEVFKSKANASRTIGKRTATGSLKYMKYAEAAQVRRSQLRVPFNLLEFAVYSNDLELLSFLLDLGEHFTKHGKATEAKSEDAQTSVYAVSGTLFTYAIEANNPPIIAELAKRCAAGLPLNRFAKRSGVELPEKPKYYQGLSVAGRKRKDWAARGRETTDYALAENEKPPLLVAANAQALESVKWFLSDAPLRCYKEFAKAHGATDKRLQRLSEAKGGFEGAVKKFKDARNHLAIHCCILGKPTKDSLEVLKYLIEVMPDAVDSKSIDGSTPLLLAFGLTRYGAAKILLQARADQTSRDKLGRNLVHRIVHGMDLEKEEHLPKVRKMLDLIDPRLLPSMFDERCSVHPGSLTPLALWLQNYSTRAWDLNILEMLLEYSKGADLDQINGSGDTPLHHMVRKEMTDFARTVITMQPGLVCRENATGRTPYEMAQDAELASNCEGPPQLHYRQTGYHPYVGSQHYQSITAIAPDWFTPAVQERRRGDKDDGGVWDLVRNTKKTLDERCEGKRRLVSLNEANEVAKRLADRQDAEVRVQKEADGNEDDEEKADPSDEVGYWSALAKREFEF